MTVPAIRAALLHRSERSDPAAFPHAAETLEEVAAATPGDVAAAFAFALSRLTSTRDARPVAVVTPQDWLGERGRPFAAGLAGFGMARERLIWVRTRREGEALWALEEALKSGAVAGGLACAAAPPFVTTRRLEFAAREGRSTGVLLRAGPAQDLSAARSRWRIASAASAPDLWDAAAPGRPRLVAELLRRRDGPPGAWILEPADEAGRFALVAGLAGDGVAARPDQPRARKRTVSVRVAA